MKKVMILCLLLISTSSLYAAHITYSYVKGDGSLNELVVINSEHIRTMTYSAEHKTLNVKINNGPIMSFMMESVDKAKEVMRRLLNAKDYSLIELKLRQ